MKSIFRIILSIFYLTVPAIAYSAEPPSTPFIRIAAEMHAARLTYLAADVESTIIATASMDKTIKLWDARSGKLQRTLRPPLAPGTEGSLNTVALSPDGKTVAAGGFTGSSWDTTYSVYLFDAASGEMTSRIPGFKRQLHRLAYSRDGRRLAVTVAGGEVHVFDTTDNKKLFSDTNYKGHIFALEFARSGTLFAASDQGEMRGYRPDGTAVFSRISDLGKRIFSISIAPDSSKFAVAYEKESRIEVDILHGDDGSWERSLDGIKGGLPAVAWSDDGNFIFTAGGKETKSGKKLLHKWSVKTRTTDEIIELPTKGVIRKLLPLESGGVAFLAPHSGFGIYSDKSGNFSSPPAKKNGRNKSQNNESTGKGGIRFFKNLATPEFSKNHDMFKISPDAGSILFSYTQFGETKALFDLKKRKLLTTELSDEGLLKPLLTGNGIDIRNWDSNTPETPRLNGKKLKKFGFGGWEYSSCLAVRPDEAGFILGTSHYLRSYNKNGKELWKQRIPERAWDVNISADSSTLVASFDDGTIRWFDIKDGRERYALYLHPDRKRWVLWLPEGYFDHAPDSESLVGFVVNRRADQSAEIVRMSRMYDLFYRPDIIDKAVNGHDISVHLKRLQTTSPKVPAIPQNTTTIKSGLSPDTDTLKLRVKEETVAEQKKQGDEQAHETARQAETTEPPPTIEEQVPLQQPSILDSVVNRETLPPHVRFITTSGTANRSDVTIAAELCDAGGGIGDVTVYLNDMPILIENDSRGLKASQKGAGAAMSACTNFERTITLGHEKNTISIMARNRNNTIESRRDQIELKLPAVTHKQPKLHILTVAVNRYRDGDLRLKYPINDAVELVRVVTEKGKNLFTDIAVYTLHDEDVTRQRLETRFREIAAQAGREDVFVLFIAGHGISEERDGMYYFLPADFRYTDPDSIIKQGISMNDFKRWLAGVQAMKSLILLDTCSSGAFAEAIASRGIMEKTAITKLARAIGRATIAASSKNQVALEGYEGHGVFSYTVIEGIKGKAANTEGQITINRLATFIEETLPVLTFKRWGYEQIPQRTLTGNDFQIGTR